MDKQKLWLKLNRIQRELRMVSHSISGDNAELEKNIIKAREELENALNILKKEIEK